MPSLTLTPLTSGPYSPGETVEFELRTSEDFPPFFGFQSQLVYNADALRLTGVVFPPDFAFLSSAAPEPADASGEITVGPILAGTVSETFSGETLLATLSFEAEQAGPAEITVEQFGTIFFGGDGNQEVYFGEPAITEIVIDVPPVAGDDSATTNEDEAVLIDVLDNDDDVGGDSFVISAIGAAANGSVTETAAGLVYTPNANFFGDDSFTYTIQDENGSTDTATVAVTVNAVNDDPTAEDDTGFLDKNTSVEIDVLANDEDVDEDPLTISDFQAATTNGGTVSQTANGLTYTPGTDFVGQDTFTYVVSDGNGGTDTATVTVQVNESNVAPVAENDFVSVDEDQSVVITPLANDGDADDDTLTVVAFGGADNGAVTQSGNTFTYTPDPDFNGPDSFTYMISDGNGGTDTATVNITVNSVNDLPTAVDDTASTEQGVAIQIAVLDNDSDPENDPLSVASFTEAANGIVTEADGILTYTPNTGFSGADSFTYTVDDGNGGSDTAAVNVNVNGVTLERVPDVDPGLLQFVLRTSAGFEPFIGVEFGLTYNADEISFLDATFNAAVDVPFVPAAPVGASGLTTLDFLGGLSGGTLSDAVDVVTFTFTQIGQGDTTVSITGSSRGFFFDADGQVIFDGEVDETFNLNIAPTAIDDTVSVDEDGAIQINVLANDSDPDDDTLSIETVSQASNGSVTVAQKVITYTPDANFFGTDTFTYEISDGRGGFATASVTVNVDPVNDAPVIVSADSFEFIEGDTAVVFTGAATDIDGPSLSFGLEGEDADLFSIDPVSGEVTFVAPPVFVEGDDNVFTVTLLASDGEDTDARDVAITLLRDQDGDLVPDLQDNAIFVANADQRDTDGDNYGNVIDTDLNQDGFTGVQDLAIFRSFFGQTGIVDGENPAANADFDGDGSVLLSDLQILRTQFGADLQGSFIDLDPIT